MKIQVILVLSLITLGSSAACAEPLFSPMFGEVAPPRPPTSIVRPHSHQPHPASPRGHGRGAAPSSKPSAVAPVNPNAATTGSSVPRGADATPTGSTRNPVSFPPVQIPE